jgi:hypothetical protein
MARVCEWCKGPFRSGARRDSVCCSKRCRRARHRFMRSARILTTVSRDRPSSSGSMCTTRQWNTRLPVTTPPGQQRAPSPTRSQAPTRPAHRDERAPPPTQNRRRPTSTNGPGNSASARSRPGRCRCQARYRRRRAASETGAPSPRFRSGVRLLGTSRHAKTAPNATQQADPERRTRSVRAPGWCGIFLHYRLRPPWLGRRR